MPRDTKIDATVSLGDGVAVIRYGKSSQPKVVGVLGIDLGADGKAERVFLDRLIHKPREDEIDGWQVSGAISSILERPATP